MSNAEVAGLAQLAGSFAGMFLFSRLWLWFARNWPNSFGKIVFVYLSLTTFIILIDGYSRADGGPWAGDQSLALHAPALIVLFAVDLIRVFRRPKAVVAHDG
jgi:hypothetical protein